MPDLRSDALWKTSATWCALAAALLAAGAAAYRSVTSTDEPRSADAAAPPQATPPSDEARTLDLVCGASPGSLGPVFAGVDLGRIVARLPDVPSRAGLGEITVQTTGRRIAGVTVVVPIDPGWADCYRFTDQLHRRWGHPSETSAGNETWHDNAHDATFTRNLRDCRLRFARVVSPEEWLNDTRSSRIPSWAIGHPVAELEAELGLPPGDDPKALHWHDDSLELTANLKAGRVTGIRVQVPFDDSLGEILWHRLEALYGVPEVTRAHEESLDVRWRARGITAGKYWGHDGDVRAACRYAQACPELREAPRRPSPDEGVLMAIAFGS